MTSPESARDEADGPTSPSEAAGAAGDESAPLVAVVVPTYNEAENLPELTSRLFALKIPNLRLIVVDDGSPDGTGELAAKLGDELGGRVGVIQRGRKMGLGTAYVAGFAEALSLGAEYVVQMDADLSHELLYVPRFLDALDRADVVVGSRYVPEGGVEESWTPSRRRLSALGNLGIRVAAGVRVKDATSGFKAFRADVLRSFDLGRFRSRGFAFQVEVAYACERRGYRVYEHPIVFASRLRGQSKMSPAIVVEALWRLPLLRWRRGP